MGYDNNNYGVNNQNQYQGAGMGQGFSMPNGMGGMGGGMGMGFPFMMQPPMMGYPQGGGFGGNMQFFPMSNSPVNIEGLGDLINATKTNGKVDAESIETAVGALNSTDWGGVIGNAAMVGGQILSSYFSGQAMNDATTTIKDGNVALAETWRKMYMGDGDNLGLMDMQLEIYTKQADLTTTLATLQKEIAIHKIDKDADVSTTNTRTTASYNYLNDKFMGGYFYGNPSMDASIFV